MQTLFNNPFHQLSLHRYPFNSNQKLQAWDASDEYMLEHLANKEILLSNSRVLIFNDTFGSLSLALQDYKPCVITDSYISKQGIIYNAKHNNIDLEKITICDSLTELNTSYDLVLIKTPKTLDYLRYFLAKIRPYLHENSQLIIAGMIKSTPKTVWKILEEMLGETSTSLAKKKARLIFVKPEKNNTDTPFPIHFTQEKTNYKIYSHANVFSKKSMDIGTRFLLQNLPTLNHINTIVDLGCGNGIVGLNLAALYPQAQVIFTDESYMAIASARLTVMSNLDSVEQHQFNIDNCLDGIENHSVDLIVCNPPFHQSHSIGLHIALQMFQQSFRALKKGGHLIVIANRHLPYHAHLKRIFGKVENLAANNKFSIFNMVK